jgi:hypothetical protein
MDNWDPLGKKPGPDQVTVAGVVVRAGDRVRLWPAGRADILDLALRGKTATVEAIEEDFEGRIHLAVTVDEDPGRDIGRLRQPGHRFFFGLQEVEPIPFGNDRLGQLFTEGPDQGEHS